jgi:hypothetical protein
MEVLVSFYDESLESVVVEHLASLNVTSTGDAQSLFDKVCDVFHKNNLPWDNLISVLLDSCNVMRGSKSGLETRLRQGKAPHLLDIDGDSCHHVHNCAKVFCKPFENYLEQLYTALHTDFKWSPDLVEAMKEICMIMGIKFTHPERFLAHRWLSSYDVSLSNIRLFDCYQLFYYSFLPVQYTRPGNTIYSNVLEAIYAKYKISVTSQRRIMEILKKLSRKNMTKEGRERKDRVVEKVIYKERKTLLVMNFYISALAMLKQYVCLFQLKEPMIHKLHDEQELLIKKFLSCFCKPEMMAGMTPKKIKALDLKPDMFLRRRDMYIGGAAQVILSKFRTNDQDALDFLQSVETAYSTCGKYMIGKLPLDSETLKALSAVDPTATGHSFSLHYLKKLPGLFPTVQINADAFQIEVHSFQVDPSLPSAFIDQTEKPVRLDIWWSRVFKSKKYPELTKVMKAVLSIFHGPMVESSFNIMGDIIDERSCRMNVTTYEAIQTVKYKLHSSNKSAIEYFHRDDKLHSPVNVRICKSMRTAYGRYQAELQEQCKAREAVQEQMQIQKKTLQSKEKAKKLLQNAERKSFLAHAEKQERIRKLTELAKKRAKANAASRNQ